MISITNYLFRQNRTRNITKVKNINNTYKKTLQRACQGDYTEDSMAASIQPPVLSAG